MLSVRSPLRLANKPPLNNAATADLLEARKSSPQTQTVPPLSPDRSSITQSPSTTSPPNKPPSNGVKTSPRKRGSSRRMIVVLCTLLIGIGVTVVVAIKGNVSGTEFAPSHFQRRDFSFYEIPGLNMQITPIRRSTAADPLQTQIRTKGWIQVPRGQKPNTWHLVRLSRGPSTTPAVASLLVDEMHVGLPNDPFWKDWNNDHPKCAATLWPVVQRLAERELYVLIPELMSLARSLPGDDNGKQLAAAIDDWLIEQYVGLISDLRAADRTRLADELLDEALQDYPEATQLTALEQTQTPSP